MGTMVAAILMLVSITVNAKPLPDPRTLPEGYWEKDFNSGGGYSARYIIKLKVKDTAEISRKVDATMGEAGARAEGSSRWSGGENMRSQNYTIGAAGAEETARALMAMGEVMMFSKNPMGDYASIGALDERIALLERELVRGKHDLANYPIAQSMLSRKLMALKRKRADLDPVSARAYVYVTLSFESDEIGRP